MKLTVSILFAVALVVAVGTFYVADTSALGSCNKASSSSVKSAGASCDVACSEAAAAVTANASACCKATIASIMTKYCNTSTASASGCSKSAAAKTASASGCSKSAAAKTASAESCFKGIEAMTANAHDCCKETVAAFMAAVAKSGTQTASSGCSKSAAAYAWAGSGSSCSKSASKAALAGSGCSKSSSTASAGSRSSCSTKSASYASIDNNMPYRTGSRLVLKGNALCGKCNLEATESCQPLFETADGKIYPLMKNDYVKKMRNSKSENGFEVVTRVRRYNGVKYLEVEHLKAL